LRCFLAFDNMLVFVDFSVFLDMLRHVLGTFFIDLVTFVKDHR